MTSPGTRAFLCTMKTSYSDELRALRHRGRALCEREKNTLPRLLSSCKTTKGRGLENNVSEYLPQHMRAHLRPQRLACSSVGNVLRGSCGGWMRALPTKTERVTPKNAMSPLAHGISILRATSTTPKEGLLKTARKEVSSETPASYIYLYGNTAIY